MKNITIGLILVSVLLISGCNINPTGNAVGPICNKPYILVGTDCCLDNDDNAICDSDEKSEEDEIEIETQKTPSFIIHFLFENRTVDGEDLLANKRFVSQMDMKTIRKEFSGLYLFIKNNEKEDIICDIYGSQYDTPLTLETMDNIIKANSDVSLYFGSMGSSDGDIVKISKKVSCKFRSGSSLSEEKEVYVTVLF